MGQKRHTRWIPKPTESEPVEAVALDYDPDYVAEIMEYYHRNCCVPDTLPDNFKAYLLAAGLAELLPNARVEYVVFTAAGGELARATNRSTHSNGRPRRTA